jgi:hypothetical protein
MMAWTCDERGCRPPADTMWLRNSRLAAPNWHLSMFSRKPPLRNLSKTRRRWWRCVCWSGLAMRMSSKVDKDKIQASHQPVHQMLERLASILQTKGHAQKLPKAKRSDDGRLVMSSALTGTW